MPTETQIDLPRPMAYVTREDALNLEAGIADCILMMREKTGRFERPVYARPEKCSAVPSAAGEVEVLAFVDETDGVFPETLVTQRDAIDAAPVGTELIDRAHFTRLQVENAALQQHLTIADQRVDDLEVELTKLKRSHEWESQRAAALLEELQDYEGSSGSLQPSLKENHGIPGTSFQRLNALANEGE